MKLVVEKFEFNVNFFLPSPELKHRQPAVRTDLSQDLRSRFEALQASFQTRPMV